MSRALCLFSGKDRAGSVQAHLRRLAASFHRDVAITLVDKRLGWKFDLCNTKVRQRYLDLVDQGYFDMVFMSPPCATFSWATWANFSGPRPVRSFQSRPSRVRKETVRFLATFWPIFVGILLSLLS